MAPPVAAAPPSAAFRAEQPAHRHRQQGVPTVRPRLFFRIRGVSRKAVTRLNEVSAGWPAASALLVGHPRGRRAGACGPPTPPGGGVGKWPVLARRQAQPAFRGRIGHDRTHGDPDGACARGARRRNPAGDGARRRDHRLLRRRHVHGGDGPLGFGKIHPVALRGGAGPSDRRMDRHDRRHAASTTWSGEPDPAAAGPGSASSSRRSTWYPR